MAKKPIPTPLPDIYDKGWAKNPLDPNGLGYSGKAIREAIQNKFLENDARLERLEEEVGGGSVDFRFVGLPSGNVFVNGAAPYPFPLFIKSVLVYKNDEGEEYEEEYDRNVHLEIEVILNGTSTVTNLGNVAANKEIEINITPYVADGAAFAFRAYNDSGNAKRTSYYDVVKANIGFGFQNNNWWAAAFVNGENWRVPMTTDVNVAALLKVSLIDKDGIVRAVKNVPSSQFSTNYDLSIDHPISGGGESGVYTMKFELVATDEKLSGLAAEPKEYKVCCVSATDDNNYLIINNEGSGFKNYTTNRIFDYSVRVGFGNPTVRIKASENGEIVSDTGELSIVNGAVYPYNLSLEMERLDDADFSLNVSFDIEEETVFAKDYTFSNNEGFAATAGAKTLIRMSGRSNSEANRAVFVNAVDGSQIRPVFTNVSWSDADGYKDIMQADGNTQTCFRLLSGSKMELPIKLLKLGSFDSLTFEIDYQVRNVLDYDTPVIECADADGSSFNGLKITPNNISMLTPSAKLPDDQNLNYDGEERNHLIVVLRRKAVGATTTADNYSAVMYYIEGCKQRSFNYAGDLNVDANLVFGSEDADIDIYAIRIYDAALTNRECETNTTNWKPTEAQKIAYKNRNNVRENGQVSFSLVRSLCNVFVFESENDTLPDISWGKKDSVKTRVEWYWREHPEWNWVLEELDLLWQGTTSHGYWRQNFKGKAAKALDFDGGNHKAIKSICWKKNFASSMQSHKIGSVLSYTDLAIRCGVIEDDERASIWQYPAVGFQRLKDGTMKFIGLYTVGPDKGDSGTFGFGDNSIAMEMSDNEPLGSNFRLPFNEDTTTNDGETYTMCGVKSFEDSMKHPELVEQHFKPAYNFVYNLSQMIRPWNGTVEELQASDATAGYDYWLVNADGEYDAFTVFYKNGSTWMPNGVNIAEQTGVDTEDKDADTLNEEFKAARVALFKEGAGQRLDVPNALFHLAYVEHRAASDNLAKNTYPYIKNCNMEHPLIRWRQDDLDTIFDIENQGKAYKKYCVEIGDDYSEYGRNPQSIFNGIYNQFWILLRTAFADEYAEFVRTKFIPALHYGATADPLTMVMAHYQHYYFDNAQEHFPEALYNEDAKYCYEESALIGSYEYSTIALSQLLGNHYSAEKYWVKMRYIYMASKYNADNFAMGAQNDTFRTRPYNPDGLGNTFEITPAIYMYPSIQEGNSKVVRGERMYPGNSTKTWTVTLEASETSDQEQRVNGMSYIRSLGKLYKDAFTGNVGVKGKMLTELLLGSKDDASNIRSRVTSVEIGDATALRLVDLANLSTLQGVNDFSTCVNLRTLYAEGTNVTSIPLSDGGPLGTLHLPPSITTLALNGKKNLTDLVIGGSDNLTTVEVTNCSDYVMGKVLDILSTVYTI